MSYAELLNRIEWQDKRKLILNRDNFQCQKCGNFGYTEHSIEISDFVAIDFFMNECRINQQSISQYLRNIIWSNHYYEPLPYNSTKCKFLKDGNFQFSFFTDLKSQEHPFCFKTKYFPNFSSYIKIHDEILIKCNNFNWKVHFYAFKFQNSSFVKSRFLRTKNGEISIFIDNKFYCFRANPYSIFNRVALDFATLHVHHKYYTAGHTPWDYPDDALITLCSNCHSITHQTEDVPLFSKNGLVLCSNLPICDRCQGRGELPEYKYYMNGICFKCNGAGVLNYY